MKTLRIMIIAGFGLLLWVPVMQLWTHVLPVPEPQLYGVVQSYTRPAWRFSAWWTGRFQREYERWFDQNLGFRACLVKTDNQLNYSLFREATGAGADRVIVGRRQMLYQKSYVEAYNRLVPPPWGRLRELAGEMRALQDLLARRGIAFLFVIGPSKAEIYPEYIPANHIEPSRQHRPSTYEIFVRQLDRAGVHYVDAHRILLAAKVQSPHLLFPPGGIHWNAYSAGMVMQATMHALERSTGKSLASLRCTPVATSRVPLPEHAELDLANLLNVWQAYPRCELPRPTLTADVPAGSLKPRMLVVADSFGAAYPMLLAEHGVTASLDYAYYFNTVEHFPGGAKWKLDRQAIDWRTLLNEQDAVVVETDEIMLANAGFGFVEAAVRALHALQ